MWAWVNVYACVCESVSMCVLGVPPCSPGTQAVNMDVKSIKERLRPVIAEWQFEMCNRGAIGVFDS